MPGVKVFDVENISPTATVIASNTVIGIVGTACITQLSNSLKEGLANTAKAGLLRFNNAEEAIKAFEACAGTLRETLYDVYCQNVKSPIIISLVEITEEQSKKNHFDFYGAPEIKTAVIEKLQALEMAKTVWGTKVIIPLVDWFTHDATVLDALSSYIAGTKSISIANMKHVDVGNALVSLNKLASERMLVNPFYRKVWSIYESAYISAPYGGIIAGHIAYWDAKLGEFGTCFDHANRPIFNMGDCEVPLSYEEGEDTCGVNIIVNGGGCLCINDPVMGNVLYNFETPKNREDSRFGKLETIRYFDLLNSEGQKSLAKHKHRPVNDVLNLALADMQVLLDKSRKANVTLGFEVWWSDENSAADISAGILHMKYKASNAVGVRTITLKGSATNEYYEVA